MGEWVEVFIQISGEATKKEGGSPTLKAVPAEKPPTSRAVCSANPQLLLRAENLIHDEVSWHERDLLPA